MQRCSHRTRSYFIDQNRLRGYLVSAVIVSMRDAIQENNLQTVSGIKPFQTQAILKTLKKMKNDQERNDFLEQNYQALFVYLLKRRGMNKILAIYMEKCKNLEEDYR